MPFSADLEEFAKAANESLDKTVRMVTLELFSSVIKSTPVGNPDLWASLNPQTDIDTRETTRRDAPDGYVGGRARGNWQTTTMIPAQGVIDGVRSGESAESELESRCGGYGEITYLTNNLPYIMRLEEGWSTQSPPQAMVRRNFRRIRAMIARAVSKNKV
jgi:hypothetical protein